MKCHPKPLAYVGKKFPACFAEADPVAFRSLSDEANMTRVKINLIGPGKVGQALMRRLVMAGEHEAQDVAQPDGLLRAGLA